VFAFKHSGQILNSLFGRKHWEIVLK